MLRIIKIDRTGCLYLLRHKPTRRERLETVRRNGGRRTKDTVRFVKRNHSVAVHLQRRSLGWQ